MARASLLSPFTCHMIRIVLAAFRSLLVLSFVDDRAGHWPTFHTLSVIWSWIMTFRSLISCASIEMIHSIMHPTSNLKLRRRTKDASSRISSGFHIGQLPTPTKAAPLFLLFGPHLMTPTRESTTLGTFSRGFSQRSQDGADVNLLRRDWLLTGICRHLEGYRNIPNERLQGMKQTGSSQGNPHSRLCGR